jgi:replicative DNA helicase
MCEVDEAVASAEKLSFEAHTAERLIIVHLVEGKSLPSEVRLEVKHFSDPFLHICFDALCVTENADLAITPNRVAMALQALGNGDWKIQALRLREMMDVTPVRVRIDNEVAVVRREHARRQLMAWTNSFAKKVMSGELMPGDAMRELRRVAFLKDSAASRRETRRHPAKL